MIRGGNFHGCARNTLAIRWKTFVAQTIAKVFPLETFVMYGK